MKGTNLRRSQHKPRVLVIKYFIPCSVIVDALPFSAGRCGKSNAITRGSLPSGIVNEPASNRKCQR